MDGPGRERTGKRWAGVRDTGSRKGGEVTREQRGNCFVMKGIT